MSRYWLYLFSALISVQACLGVDFIDCLVTGEEGCAEDQLRQVLTRAETLPSLRITRDLSILTNPESANEVDPMDGSISTLEKLERYLYAHSLKLELPEELMNGAKGLVPESILNNLPKSIVLPLAQDNTNEGRGIMKKIIVPFILGLKFKATAVVPLALAFIALKTWKALTLGLLSIVLTGAMVIFRLTKPKVLNYEVYYPHHHHVDEHYHGRSSSSDLPYRAHAN